MTLTDEDVRQDEVEIVPEQASQAPPEATEPAIQTPESLYAPAPRRTGTLVLVWLAVVVVSVGIVLYEVESLFSERSQQRLLDDYQDTLVDAAFQGQGLPGVEVLTLAPDQGSPVALLEVKGLDLRAVVVEGATPDQTRIGPGHVPGTSGPGQPGNSVIVGRRTMFGSSFASLDNLEEGDELFVTTIQGQSRYVVRSVEQVTIKEPSEEIATTPALEGVELDAVYGPTEADQLTLVSSSTAIPWNQSDAVVVVAELDGRPFPPTPQAGRSYSETGREGSPGAWAAAVVWFALFAAGCLAVVWCRRNLGPRIAYLLCALPLLALLVLASESLSRLLPGWA